MADWDADPDWWAIAMSHAHRLHHIHIDRYGTEQRDARCGVVQRQRSEGQPCERRCTKAAGHVGSHAFENWHLS